MVSFINPDTLKQAVLDFSPKEFFDNYILGKNTPHFDGVRLDFVSEAFNEEYGISPKREDLIVVGSSKLGFALHKKMRSGEVVAPAFRAFGPESDIDLSICCSNLFDLLWYEISACACDQAVIPYRHRSLGDYLTYGWLRQDQLPIAPASKLIKCDNLRLVRGKIRKDRKRGHPKIDFGIFHSVDHLKLYQMRSIGACRKSLEFPL
jgi:hypothetical protein